MRVLVVDDDQVVLQWVRKHFEARGFEVVDARSGEYGLHIYKTQGPWDFVLSDYCFLPSKKIKNGLELVKAIHAINPDQRIAIHTGEENFTASVPLLHKPYMIGALLRLLREPVRSLLLPF